MSDFIVDTNVLQTALERHTIGTFVGNEPGPLLICTAAMHGNEWAGAKAIETVLTLLEREPLVNPGFSYRGVFLGLLGNAGAYAEKKRFIKEDLNRMWTPARIAKVRSMPWQSLEAEERELFELVTVIEHYIGLFEPTRIVLLDLHTTSAQGGIFAIATDHPESVRIAMELHAPVITGMLVGLQGTTLHYFTKENFKVPTVGVAFEAGQHDDPLSVNRSISAVVNCMRSIRSVRPEDVENRHDALLIEYSKDLPRLARLVTVHHIRPEDNFRMMPGFRNFQPVTKGELLAVDVRGPIYSPIDGMILMPLYQPQGTDGFFLIKEAF